MENEATKPETKAKDVVKTQLTDGSNRLNRGLRDKLLVAYGTLNGMNAGKDVEPPIPGHVIEPLKNLLFPGE